MGYTSLILAIIGVSVCWLPQVGWLGVALGVVGSVFISLLWLYLVFQVLMYGAAFARLRRDRDRVRREAPRL